MKNSAIIIDINVRKNIVAWASLKTNDPTHVKRGATQAIAAEPVPEGARRKADWR